MPQNTIVTPENAPSRKILITYKKVDKLAIQGNFNLSKSGYNWLEISNDEILKIEGVTSLKIINVGDEEVKINGIVLLPLPHYDITKNKSIDGSNQFWDLIDRAMCRNSKIFVLPDGTYSDITLNIDFLGEESNAVCDKPNLPAYPQEATLNEIISYNIIPAPPAPPFVPFSAVVAQPLTANVDFVPNKSGTFQLVVWGATVPTTVTGIAGSSLQLINIYGSFSAVFSIVLVETGEQLFFDENGNYLSRGSSFVRPTNGTFENLEHPFTIFREIGSSVKVIYRGTNAQYFEAIMPCVLGNNPIIYEVITSTTDGNGNTTYETTTVGVPLHFVDAFPVTIQFQRLDTMEFSEVFGNAWVK